MIQKGDSHISSPLPLPAFAYETDVIIQKTFRFADHVIYRHRYSYACKIDIYQFETFPDISEPNPTSYPDWIRTRSNRERKRWRGSPSLLWETIILILLKCHCVISMN